jgi:acetolactate synthase I/II/III large subunit
MDSIRMNCSEQIASLIDVKHCFLLPGGGNQPLVEAFRSRAVCLLHEHSCAVAAEAYAQIKGLGLALVTTGPGVTNAMTGLAAAWLDSTPLVLLSGQVKTQYRARGGVRQGGFQELPSTELTKPITKLSQTVEHNDVVYWTEIALATAKAHRPGPVHLDVPLDVQGGNTSEEVGGWPNNNDRDNSTVAAQRVAELLRKAERPVLLVGNGARREHVRELIEAIGLPTLLTWRAADFLEETHPLFCGRSGITGQRGANFVQQSCDLLVCVGARMDIGQIGYDASLLVPRANKFVIDIDEAEAKKNQHYHFRFVETGKSGGSMTKWGHAVCDGARFLEELDKCWIARRPRAPEKQPTYSWLNWCRQTHDRYRPRNAFYDALSAALRPDDVIVAGSSGTAAESTLQHISIKRGQRLVFSPGLGSMGFGLPAAIGAHFATGRRVVCVEGDGSFAMNSFELETVRRLNLPIKVFVIRNGGYESIKRTQRNSGHGECVPSVPDPIELGAVHKIGMYWGESTFDSAAWKNDRPAVIAIDADCSLLHRMSTNPPGKPEDMLPALSEAEQLEAMRCL